MSINQQPTGGVRLSVRLSFKGLLCFLISVKKNSDFQVIFGSWVTAWLWPLSWNDWELLVALLLLSVCLKWTTVPSWLLASVCFRSQQILCPSPKHLPWFSHSWLIILLPQSGHAQGWWVTSTKSWSRCAVDLLRIPTAHLGTDDRVPQVWVTMQALKVVLSRELYKNMQHMIYSKHIINDDFHIILGHLSLEASEKKFKLYRISKSPTHLAAVKANEGK